LAKRSASDNGHNRLEEAVAILIQNQASFLTHTAETERATSQRFARIEADIAAILRILSEHSRLLERLPEAVREKIGFKTPT
jgi:hypothetical protein